MKAITGWLLYIAAIMFLVMVGVTQATTYNYWNETATLQYKKLSVKDVAQIVALTESVQDNLSHGKNTYTVVTIRR
jgi:hypothetical protein